MNLDDAITVALLRGERFTREQALELGIKVVSDPRNIEYGKDGGPQLEDCQPLVDEFERIKQDADAMVPGMDVAHGKLALSVAALVFYVSRPTVAPRVREFRARGN